MLDVRAYVEGISSRAASRLLHQKFGVVIGHQQISRIWSRNTRRVTTHSGHNKKPAALRARAVRLVYGRDRLDREGCRTHRHSLAKTLAIINDDQKEDVVSESTLRLWLAAEGLVWRIRRQGPAITATNRLQRIAYRERHRHRTALTWQTIVFSDSVPLGPNHQHNRHNDGLWLKRGDRCPATRKLRRPDHYIHCYAAVTRHGIAGPFFIYGNITARRYIDEILVKLIPAVQLLMGDEPFLFQQDGASAHTANITQKWLRDSGISFIAKDGWPGNSADLNVIEGVWPLIQRAVAPPGQFAVSDRAIEMRARRWCRDFSVDDCRKLQSSSLRRMSLLDEWNFWSLPV